MAGPKYTRVWLHRDAKQVAKMGERNAPWYVAWMDPETHKRRVKKIGKKLEAERYAAELQRRLNEDGILTADRTWAELRAQFHVETRAKKRPGTVVQDGIALDHFERLANPSSLQRIDNSMLARFVDARLIEKNGLSPATVNRDLRIIQAVLRFAKTRKYLHEVPEIPFLREPEKLPTYITTDQMVELYNHASAAQYPDDQHYEPADWWRGLLVFLQMTGWRINETLLLTWENVDFDRGLAITRAETNKGGRDDVSPLHSIVLEHIDKLKTFAESVFPWSRHRRHLWTEFARIQDAAGIAKSVDRETGKVTRFGFHDIRRGFATLNAGSMTAQQLQATMRHRDYSTTLRYVNMAAQLKGATDHLHVPAFQQQRKGDAS